MRIPLDMLKEKPVVMEARLSPAYLAAELEEPLALEEAHGDIEFSLHGEEVSANGEIQGAAQLQCVRCLKPFRQPLRAPVQLNFWPREELPEGQTEEVRVDDPDYALYQGDAIEPDEELRELLLVEIPLLPVCHEDCPGLCPHCGADLNDAPCGCEKSTEPQQDQPAWKAALKNIDLGK